MSTVFPDRLTIGNLVYAIDSTPLEPYLASLPEQPPRRVSPFSQRGYENYTLGDATQQSLREIWNGAAYRSFRDALLSDKPPGSCANCGLRWSL